MNTENFRVYLRAFEPEDYLTKIKWHNDDEIWDMVGSPKYFVSKEYEKKWVDDAIWGKGGIKLGVCLKETDELIGFCSIIDIDWINRTAQWSSMIGAKQYWGQGLASEARMLILDFAFRERGFNRVWAVILEDNIASIKMCEKCGYKKEGLLRQSIYKNGEYKNQVVMSILRHEFDDMLKENKMS